MKWAQFIISVLLVALLASGCSLFRDEEELVTAPESTEPDNDGEWVLEPQTVSAGTGSALLVIEFPEGWHINTDAPPFQANWDVDGSVVQMDTADQEMRIVGPVFPLNVPVTLTEGETEVAVQLQAFYCNDDRTLCTVERRTLVAPLSVGASGENSEFILAYTIVPPEMP